MPVDETRPSASRSRFRAAATPLADDTLGVGTVTVAPLRTPDAPALFSAFRGADAMWDYMPIGPFATEAEVADWIAGRENSDDPLFFTFTPEGEDAAGFGSYLRITPAAGSIEVGFLSFSPRLQRSVAATEAMYLMMKWAFEAGYRRYEWKCDALNAAVPAGGAAAGPVLRGRVPAGDRGEGAQPRHRMVRRHRRRMARAGGRVPDLARAGEFRRRGRQKTSLSRSHGARSSSRPIPRWPRSAPEAPGSGR
jgi:RimJ/RimL family protein N-acetyltransferase